MESPHIRVQVSIAPGEGDECRDPPVGDLVVDILPLSPATGEAHQRHPGKKMDVIVNDDTARHISIWETYAIRHRRQAYVATRSLSSLGSNCDQVADEGERVLKRKGDGNGLWGRSYPTLVVRS